MNRYRELNKDIERLHEWRQNHIDSKEAYLQTTARLSYRRKQLISELNIIYPIKHVSINKNFVNLKLLKKYMYKYIYICICVF